MTQQTVPIKTRGCLCQKSGTKNPKQTAVLVERARLRLATGRVQEAVPDLTQALSLEPSSAAAHFLLSKAYQFRGEEVAR